MATIVLQTAVNEKTYSKMKRICKEKNLSVYKLIQNSISDYLEKYDGYENNNEE